MIDKQFEMSMEMTETKQEKNPIKILEPSEDRFSIFPIKHKDLWDFYKNHCAALWTAEEIDLSKDLSDFEEKLTDNERYFIKNILAFFNQSDGIVNENIVLNFNREVQYPEAKAFYAIQTFMETIHAETYSLLIDTYVKDLEEKNKLFAAIQNFPVIAKKANWARKWIDSPSFAERLVAFVAVEGIFFSGSFCAIFWLKHRQLMTNGLGFANTLINKDENLHCEFAINLINNYLEHERPSRETITKIILEALEVEKEFVTDSLPVSLIGMNKNLMIQYLEFVADNLLIKLGCNKVFNSTNPFPWMEDIALRGVTNFFEKRVGDYQKPGENQGQLNVNFNTSLLDDDF